MTDSDAQAELIDHLQIVLAERHQAPVERIETHISSLLLVGGRAYKIKKPVNFGFLDFSSLEQRKFYCEEEMRLNSRFAADLYLAIHPIGGSLQQPEIDADGPALEYMIEMQRFAAGYEFKHMAETGSLQPQWIDELADLLADFHAGANVCQASPDASVDNERDKCLQNFSQIQSLPDSVLQALGKSSLSLIEDLQQWTEQQFMQLKPFLLQRLQSGFVKECHGDLHLGNITLHQGKVLIFDGIEFNRDFLWIDVISDLAFLVMDLCYEKLDDLAWRLLNRYLQHSGDYAGMALLNYYLVYRAMVRAKVSLLRLSQLEQRCEEQQAEYQAMLDSAISHIQLAIRLTQPQQPFLMITMGVSGSGKSYHSARLMQQQHALRLRSDVERLRLYPDVKQRYSASARARVYQDLYRKAGALLEAGFHVILDATFLRRDEREQAYQLALKQQAKFKILFVEADKAELEQRIVQRNQAADDASEADIAVMHRQLEQLQPLDSFEQQFVVRIEG